MQISHPNNIKENWITGGEYLPSIFLKNINEYAEFNSAKKTSKEGGNLLFSGHVMLVKFNPISSSLKYCFVKGVVIPQTRVNDSPYSVWFCIHNDGSILTRECGWVEGLISSCKHVFAIFHYIENKVTLRHNKTCTSKKQKWGVRMYRKSEKSHPSTKIGNVSFPKPHPEYKYDKIPRCLSRKRSLLTLDHLMILMYRFVRKIGKNLQKQQMVLPVSSNLFQPFFQVLLSHYP